MADDGAGAAPAAAAAASASASSAVATPETTPGCTAPFFGVKHYLHRFYGLSDDECHATNVWQQIHAELNEEEEARWRQQRNEKLRRPAAGWWRGGRFCFGCCIGLGTLVIILGVAGMMIGYLLPRHSMDESDLKRWILAHQRAHGRPHAAAAAAAAAAADVGDSRAADEYNNLLDLLKIAGLVASLVGCLVIVTTLMVPACSSGLAADSANSVWSDKDELYSEDEQRVVYPAGGTKLSQALRNCLRSFHLKTHSTVFYSGLVAAPHDVKIPVLEQLSSVQPRQ